MRSSAEAVTVARDVASSSPSKPAPALDMTRFFAAPFDLRSLNGLFSLKFCSLFQRPSSDCLPLPNGIAAAAASGSGSRKPAPAPAPRSSKDDAAPAVATDSARLAAFLASTSLEPKPRARASQPPAQAAPSSSPAAVATRSPARDQGHQHHHHHHSDFSDPASPSAAVVGGGGGEVLLQWGQNKRSRGRRDAAAASGASPQRRQPGAKIQRRSPAPTDKLMPPPSGTSYTRGSTLRAASPLPPRSGAGIGSSDAHHGRGALPNHHHRSAEERAGGKSAAAAAGKQRAASDKAQQQGQGHKAGQGPVMGLAVPDPKAQHQHHQGGSGSQQQAGGAGAASSSSKPAPKLELPRIYTTLSRKEKEEDFLAMKGTKLPQRPKRRPKNVEKAVNFICPGAWLTDVTRSRYEVREKKGPKKQQKHRGLKGMESMDSDSD
ncbi:hypothetical protein BAE44_0004511 [Dichanthelium oligosanthes]|uniref:DUF1639 domain-containing protein n=1 Tax=Dichanthelium oligosanthes TaxID=888268 RepID=A0A1E5WAP5_9POAL|nr:hypothetical protein BAE44_0004511 [Dichanthelium oligosanthes]